MSIFDRPVEAPKSLSEVADPCTEIYYPDWSSRGIRAVRCTRPAKGTLEGRTMQGEEPRRVCGIHAKSWQRAGYTVARP